MVNRNGVVTSDNGDDNINYQGRQPGTLANDFTHPICKSEGQDGVSGISKHLPPVKPRT